MAFKSPGMGTCAQDNAHGCRGQLENSHGCVTTERSWSASKVTKKFMSSIMTSSHIILCPQ
jgi:hypothetical protein